MKCFYHKIDLDGLCSGAIIKYKYPECKLTGMDYNDDVDINKMKDDIVFMVDFSIKPELMLELEKRCEEFHWIDHHEGIINDRSIYWQLEDICGMRNIKYAACELTWKYLFNSDGVLKPKILPRFIWLLGRYDTWDLKASEHILPFQYAMKGLAKTPEDTVWSNLFSDYETFEDTKNDGIVDEIIKRGGIIIEHIKVENEKFVKIAAFDIEFDGKKAIACNKGATNSQLFDSVWDESKYDLMMPFYRANNGKWIVSLYTTKKDIDCSEIAKRYNGGGHKNAAGFVCEQLPFYGG